MDEDVSREELRTKMIVLQAENMDLRALIKSEAERKLKLGNVITDALNRVTEEQIAMKNQLQVITRERDTARTKVKEKKKQIGSLKSTVCVLTEHVRRLQECLNHDLTHRGKRKFDEEQVYYDKLIASGGTFNTHSPPVILQRRHAEDSPQPQNDPPSASSLDKHDDSTSFHSPPSSPQHGPGGDDNDRYTRYVDTFLI